MSWNSQPLLFEQQVTSLHISYASLWDLMMDCVAEKATDFRQAFQRLATFPEGMPNLVVTLPTELENAIRPP